MTIGNTSFQAMRSATMRWKPNNIPFSARLRHSAGLSNNASALLEIAAEAAGTQAAKVEDIAARRRASRKAKARHPMSHTPATKQGKIPHPNTSTDDEGALAELRSAWMAADALRAHWDLAPARIREAFVREV